MTPLEFAQRHPILYHATAPGQADAILEHGLYPARDLIRDALISEQEKVRLLKARRDSSVPLDHPKVGHVTLSDNRPLSETKLAKCLDDGLSPADWLERLNSRIFFWVDKKRLHGLTNAQAYRVKGKEVLEVDSKRLLAEYDGLAEICPINSGATLHQPARRGLSTFAPLFSTDYQSWRRQRGLKTPDRIVELVVVGAIPNIRDFVIRVIPSGAA